LAKKKKTMKKKASDTKTNHKTPNGLKVYRVNGAQRKEQAKARKEKTIQTFLIVLIIILAVAAIFSAIQTFFPDLFGGVSLSGKLAARVNGVPITMQQLDADYERLPLQYKYFVTKDQFLTQLIDETLMVQEAQRIGLTATEEEVDGSIQTFMQDSNVTSERLDEILEEKGLTQEQLRVLIRNQLLIDKLLEQAVKSKINVTTAQALQYYNDNPDTFTVPELVTARHILIGLANRTEEEAEERADMVFELVKNDTKRFCSYVWLYTDDSGSAETCGVYSFPRGQMVEEFENRAFDQDIGEMSVVKTTFGYHIIQTTNKTPEHPVSFRDVQEQIVLTLETQQEKMLYSDFIAGLREEATIVNYLEQEAEEEMAEAEEEGQIDIVIEEPEGEEAEEEPAEPVAGTEGVVSVEVSVTDEEVEEAEELAEEQEELEEEVEEAIEEVEEVVVVVEEVEPTKPSMNFVECLTDYGALLYGAYWDSSTKKQKDYFGADTSKLEYVECGVEGDFRAQQVACADAGILAYPTWIIDDTQHMGLLTPEQLSALTGCEI